MDASALATRVTSVTIPVRDGWRLSATRYEPLVSKARGAAFIAPAMGASQARYAPFARFLARDGWTVVTFDYRGIGASRAAPRGAPAPTMLAWGVEDIRAVIDWLARSAPNQPLAAVTHSIGGQLLPLASNSGRVTAVLAISTPKSFWRLWRGPRKLVVYAFFRLLIPLSLLLFGRLPMRALGLHDLPPGVARDWARTSRSADYPDDRGRSFLGRFARFRAPILALSFADDLLYAPASSVDYLLERYYVNAPRLRLDIVPAAYGLSAVGHSGFFTGRVPIRWWRIASQWLRRPFAFLEARP